MILLLQDVINVDKELVYENIYDLINNGFFLDKYIELTPQKNADDILMDELDLEKQYEETKSLENTAANIFNAIIIGCQLFDDKERIERFVDMFSYHIDPYFLELCLPDFDITKEEAINRLNHGFVVHFTTPKISEKIQETGKLIGSGKNAMFTKEEDKIIKDAEIEQKKNNPTAETTLNYLFRGWGTGVSSYGSTTNGFWMYHTPESLTFLFGDISKRDKKAAMSFVMERISSIAEEDKNKVIDTMSNIYDRLIGDEQNTCCILIDRDAFKYEVDYYYGSGTPVGVERRPFSSGFNSIYSNNSLIDSDIDVNYLRFLNIPTVKELERQKSNKLMNDKSSHKL